jgi:molybdate transport system substrate-binding protein
MCHRSSRPCVIAIVLAMLLALLVIALVACGSEEAATTTSLGSVTSEVGATATSAVGTTQDLTISAASSLKAAFTEIGTAFDAANNSKTTFNFDASGTLQKQIEGGAPVDVFAAAATKQMNALLDQSLVDKDSVKVFAGNGIAVVVPAGSKLAITGFEDLTRGDVKKITYGDPKAAPHGVAAEEILNKLGIFDQVKPKVIYATNASQALEYVSRGEVDAAIIFASEAKAGGDKIKIVAVADPSWYGPIAYPIAIVSASKVKTSGQTFIDYVMGPAGQSILQKHGFLPAP